MGFGRNEAMCSCLRIIGHIGQFTKQVWARLGIWKSDQLEKAQGWDFRVRFFEGLGHLTGL